MGTFRRHIKGFTAIGNDIMNDERLTSDAFTTLVYLRSKPHDWIVRRWELAKRWKFGRVRLRKAIWLLIETAWITAIPFRDQDTGRFDVGYEVHDGCGPGMSVAEIRAMFSGVASEDAEEEDASHRVSATRCRE
jgi:hypothetical protein